MTDITPLLSDILVTSHSQPALPSPAALVQKLDAFLEEANAINTKISDLVTYLRQVRQPYLSTAPPPRRGTANVSASGVPSYLDDSQREQIDSTTSQVLRDLNANITNLDQASNLRSTTEATLLERKYGKNKGFLYHWASGEGDAPDAGKGQDQLEDEGKAKTVQTFRSSVVWYLKAALRTAAGRRQEMVQIRIDRRREQEMSVLYKAKAKRSPVHADTALANRDAYGNMDTRGRSVNMALEAEQDAAIRAQLTPEQLQLFEEENSSLLNHYNDVLAQVTQAEKSLIEISDLQSQLVGELTRQGDMIEQLVTDAQGTDENVKRGNKELKRASERGSTAKSVFWMTVGLCGFLIGWDLVF